MGIDVVPKITIPYIFIRLAANNPRQYIPGILIPIPTQIQMDAKLFSAQISISIGNDHMPYVFSTPTPTIHADDNREFGIQIGNKYGFQLVFILIIIIVT